MEELWSGIRVILQVILHSKLKVFVPLNKIHLWYKTQYEISTFFVKSVKGGLIIESFSRFLKSPKKLPKTILSTTHKLKKLRIVIWYFFGESQTKKLSEITPPLLHWTFDLVQRPEVDNLDVKLKNLFM